MFNAHELEPSCTHWNGIRMGMEHHGVNYREFDWRNNPEEEALKAVEDFKPDLVIYGLSDVLTSAFANELKGMKRAFWWAEYRDKLTGGYMDANLTSIIDYFFVSNDSQREFYREHAGLPAIYLGQAGFKGEVVKDYDYDVIFIGGKVNNGIMGARYRLFQELETPYTHLNEDTLEKRMKLYAAMPSIYNTSKICLDASHSWRSKYYVSGRYYHIACNGGFSVCKRFPGCEDLFPTGVGKVYFDTPREADELLLYYLQHEDERKEIAMKGQAHALEHHTYNNRIETLLKETGLWTSKE